MRSEKEIEEKIAELRAHAPNFSTMVAVMVLEWVRGDDIGGMLRSAIEKSVESLREYWEKPTHSFSEIRCANDGAVCAHSNIRFEDGNAICESCGESLRLAPAQPPHAPATPPPKG